MSKRRLCSPARIPCTRDLLLVTSMPSPSGFLQRRAEAQAITSLLCCQSPDVIRVDTFDLLSALGLRAAQRLRQRSQFRTRGSIVRRTCVYRIRNPSDKTGYCRTRLLCPRVRSAKRGTLTKKKSLLCKLNYSADVNSHQIQLARGGRPSNGWVLAGIH